MRTEFIQFRKNAPHGLAAPDSPLGLQPDGSMVCAIDNCPDKMVVAKLLERLSGLFPAVGVNRVDFQDLPPPRGGCCGSCGG